MKIVTRRQPGEDVLRDSAILQRTLNALRGNALVPRGVYRFASHEEADAWMTLQIAATHARSATSRRSRHARDGKRPTEGCPQLGERTRFRNNSST
jgi:hypothetical protein